MPPVATSSGTCSCQLHHYIHVVSGIAEFAFLTVAVIVAVRRTRGETTWQARAYRVILKC